MLKNEQVTNFTKNHATVNVTLSHFLFNFRPADFPSVVFVSCLKSTCRVLLENLNGQPGWIKSVFI